MSAPPVLFIIFRREDTTRQVFEAIRRARPERLFVAADGPRPGKEGEPEACQATRAVVNLVDWPCEVKTLFQPTNLGIKEGVVTAIRWFFDQVPEGIILEDDCLPHPDFFRFAGMLLEKYRHDQRIFQISGTNFQPEPRSDASYYFSRYNHVWGWASWARAWDAYDKDLGGLDAFLETADRTGFWESSKERKYWSKIWKWTRSGRVKTWDYQWKLTLWKEGALCVCPEKNLVTNLGFGDGATNTGTVSTDKAARPLEALGELVHPAFVVRHRVADRFTFHRLYWGHPWARFVRRLAKLARWRGRP
jgi:hypothetical protein